MMNMRRIHAFTLIELLFVIAIIALLAGLLVPVMQGFADKGRDLKCQQNLRNLFVLLNSAANDNDNQYPRIETDPQNPIHAGDPLAKTLLEAIRPYGGSEKDIQCPLDLAGPNWFAKKHTSYMWQPMSEDEPTTNIKMYTRRGSIPMKLSRVRLLQDWDLVHGAAEPGMRKRMNVVYADGHVMAR
jgi:prepilin-type N-terminal cleavage/methylation domain-containing protein/prepilin-type processing-associated H-X9-DG protein